jgi:hypothetical protein
VYYIIEGTGEFVTGGSYDPKNRTAGITGGGEHSFKDVFKDALQGEKKSERINNSVFAQPSG